MTRRLDANPEILPESVSDLTRVRGFVARIPELQEALRSVGGSERELLIRAELRRTIDRLSGAFGAAAAMESDVGHAALFMAAAMAARELAGAGEAAAEH